MNIRHQGELHFPRCVFILLIIVVSLLYSVSYFIIVVVVEGINSLTLRFHGLVVAVK